jgi:CBS domain-containing protein
MTVTAVEPLRLTQLLRSPLVDIGGDKIGRVDDAVVRLGSGGYPQIVGIQSRIGGRQVFVPIAQVAEFASGRVQLIGRTVDLGRFERREGEVLLGADILGRRLINVSNGRLIHAGDLELKQVNGAWRVQGVDTARRGILGSLHRGDHRARSMTVDWSNVEPFVGHVPTAKLRLPLIRLRRLHPAQIADLVEAVSHDEGEEIITAVGDDPELEADVFEELDTEHQLEFLRNKPDAEAAEILATMAPDDAADLISDLPQERRSSLLERLPTIQQAKVRGLLAYNPSTAGGLMTPDFLSVGQNARVSDLLSLVESAEIAVSTVYLLDEGGRLVASASITALLRAPHDSPCKDSLEPIPARTRVDADFTEVALTMADYNLTALPVVDQDDHMLGVISVDDVLETLIPDEWRRRTAGNVG